MGKTEIIAMMAKEMEIAQVDVKFIVDKFLNAMMGSIAALKPEIGRAHV